MEYPVEVLLILQYMSGSSATCSSTTTVHVLHTSVLVENSIYVAV